MSHDPISLLESAYEPCGSPAAWLQQNAPKIAAPFDEPGFGAISYFVRDGRPVPIELTYHPGAQLDAGRETVIGAMATSLAQMPAEQFVPFLLALQRPGVHGFIDDFDAKLEALGTIHPTIEDSYGMLMPTGEGTVGIIGTFCLHTISFTPEVRALWERVAIHLGAACRLSARASGTEAPDVEAVLEPGGKLLDARGRAQGRDAWETLREGVRGRDRARTRAGRAEPLAALERWHALLAGRWSLVDHTDRDGRRSVLARRNDPDPATPGPLTRRQRQVLFYASVGWSLKQIAYALGLAEGTITRHLALALRRTGIGSRAELIRITTEHAFAALSPAPARLDPDLSEAERDVVQRVAAGWSNLRIARRRKVSPRTVANQLTGIYRKLGLRDRHELIHWMASRPPRAASS